MSGYLLWYDVEVVVTLVSSSVACRPRCAQCFSRPRSGWTVSFRGERFVAVLVAVVFNWVLHRPPWRVLSLLVDVALAGLFPRALNVPYGPGQVTGRGGRGLQAATPS